MRPPLFKLRSLAIFPLLGLICSAAPATHSSAYRLSSSNVGDAIAATAAPTTCHAITDPQALVRAPFEVRLRKLHLVRPDLIPYPIFFEVYC